MVASETALSAGAQGKFLEMDKLLFARQKTIPTLLRNKAIEMGVPLEERSEEVQRELFIDLATLLNLDVDQVRHDLENQTFRAQVAAETAEAVRVGARGTPASFVNGRYIRGAKPFEMFRREIQKEIDWARNGNRPSFQTGTDVARQRPTQPAPAPTPSQGKEMVFDVPVGETFFVGPPRATVTLISFLDYQ